MRARYDGEGSKVSKVDTDRRAISLIARYCGFVEAFMSGYVIALPEPLQDSTTGAQTSIQQGDGQSIGFGVANWTAPQVAHPGVVVLGPGSGLSNLFLPSAPVHCKVKASMFHAREGVGSTSAPPKGCCCVGLVEVHFDGVVGTWK